MLFNSVEFIFFFLPASVLLFYLVDRWLSRQWAVLALALASLGFYGWWDYRYVWVIVASVVVNFVLARAVAAADGKARWALAALAVVLNLGLLGGFKYLDFVLAVAGGVPVAEFTSKDVIVPIGISFYTFQQIAFVIDVYRRRTVELNPRGYLLFVTFFPQLIAGPIVHHREMMPQFRAAARSDLAQNLAVGTTIFVIGLAKKMLLADGFATIASPLFDQAAAGHGLGLWQAWMAPLAYGLQIYFDFSGYSDMAIGLGRMFGIRLPINFASPYKAASAIDFWRRWHITLSRFLRDYFYIPLGGSRRGRGRTYANMILTMLIGGVWHGAGWTFIAWGAIHAAAIAINHLWRDLGMEGRIGPRLGWLITFVVVIAAWAPFRADTIAAAGAMYAAMLGLGGAVAAVPPAALWAPLAAGLALVVLAPNTQTLLADFEPGLGSPGYPDPVEKTGPWRVFVPRGWTPSTAKAVLVGFLFAACVAKLNDVSEFIYFQF